MMMKKFKEFGTSIGIENNDLRKIINKYEKVLEKLKLKNDSFKDEVHDLNHKLKSLNRQRIKDKD
jgi:cell division protein FtsB